MLSAIPCSSHIKICTLIEFTEATLHFQKTQVLISQSTKYKQIPGPRASDPGNGQLTWLSLSHLGGLYSSALLAAKERKLLALEQKEAQILSSCLQMPDVHKDVLPLEPRQPAFCGVFSSCSDQSLGSRLASFLEFVLNSFLYI